ASAARERLTKVDDQEALHDFRVAMRRLRSTLRAYQPQRAALLPAKLRRRLRELARPTGEARAVEVQIAWLERRRTELPPGGRAGGAHAAAPQAGAAAPGRSPRPSRRDRAAGARGGGGGGGAHPPAARAGSRWCSRCGSARPKTGDERPAGARAGGPCDPG